MESGGGEIQCRLERDLRPLPTAVELRVQSSKESAASEWGRSGRGFSFPFACVSEHTQFAEAAETNHVR